MRIVPVTGPPRHLGLNLTGPATVMSQAAAQTPPAPRVPPSVMSSSSAAPSKPDTLEIGEAQTMASINISALTGLAKVAQLANSFNPAFHTEG